MKKICWLKDHFEEVFMVASLGMITIAMFAQVISRYVFNSSLVWTEEISRYFFILLAFSGLSYGVRAGAHLRIDLFETFVPMLKKPFEYLTDLCFVVFCVLMLRPAYAGVVFIRDSGQVSPAMEIPMYIVYLPLAFAIVLSLLRIVEKYVHKLLHYKKGHRIVGER